MSKKNTIIRTSQHRRNKDFDKLLVLKTYKDKKEALAAECGIIRYLSLFRNDFNVNGKYEILCYTTMKREVIK